MSMRHLHVPILLALGLTSCGPDGSGGSGAPATGDPPEIQVATEWRVGEPGDSILFGQLNHVATTPDGQVWVYDAHASELIGFGDDGRMTRRIGRKGSGPGEFQMVLGLRSLRDGTLVVWDAGNSRVTLLEPDGRRPSSFRVEQPFFAAEALQVDDADHIYVRVSGRGSADASQEGEGRLTYVKFTRSGQRVEEVESPVLASESGFVLNSRSESSEPFSVWEKPLVSSSGGWIVGDNASYTLRLMDPGAEQKASTVPHTPVTVQAGEREEWEAWARFFVDRLGSPLVEIPTVKPAFRDLFTDSDGRIWVRLYAPGQVDDASGEREPDDPRPPRRWWEPPIYDVFTPDLARVGRLALPRSWRLAAARGDHLWIVAHEETGDQLIKMKMAGEPVF